MNKKLVFVFVFAFLIRLFFLNQSLWLDEATTARVAQEYNYLGILTKFSPFDFHPPFYYWLIKAWTTLFGYSEISLRLPSVFFSLAAGYFVYLIGKLIRDEKTGLWAAVFFLFNPLIVYYSQEARMYMMVTFFLTGAIFFHISKVKSHNSKAQVKSQIFFGIFILLSLFTFYGSIFLVAALLLYFLVKKQYKDLFVSLLVLFIYFLVVSPLLFQQLANAKVTLSIVKNWSLVLGKASIKNLLLIPMKFSVGRIDFYPKWLYYLVAGGWTGFIIIQILIIPTSLFELRGASKYQDDRSKVKNLLFFLMLTPLVLGFCISFFSPLLQYFRFIFLIPILSILLAFQSSTKVKQITLLGFVFFSAVYLFNPQFHREDWKSMAKAIPETAVVFMIKSSSDPLKYYRKEGKIKNLASLENLASLKRIFVVPYTADIYGINYQDQLIKKGYKLKNKMAFRDLFLEEWARVN